MAVEGEGAFGRLRTSAWAGELHGGDSCAESRSVELRCVSPEFPEFALNSRLVTRSAWVRSFPRGANWELAYVREGSVRPGDECCQRGRTTMMLKLRIRARYACKNDVTLKLGDCRPLLRQLPDESVKLIVTSPPYNLGKAYEQKRKLDSYTAEQADIIAECVRVLRKDGSLCWQVGNCVSLRGQILPLDIHFHRIFADCGLHLRNRIVWQFEHGLHARRRFSGRHETILWYTKGDSYTFNLDAVRVPQKYPGKKAYKGPGKGRYSGNPNGKNPGDVWAIPNVKANHPEKTVHPCQFPIELVERLVLALSDPGDLVVDPFVGVGTTLLAAVLHGRRAAGADIMKEYVAIARQRLAQAERATLKRRPLGTPIYIPPPNSGLLIRRAPSTER